MPPYSRLDKVLASQNAGSRKEVAALIKSGAVAVNGTVVLRPEFKTDPGLDVLTVNGKTFSYNQFIYIMMNKPKGVLSATEDSRCSTVLDLVPDEMRRRGLAPAGRLDKDTTGLLIITNDGEMAHRMLSPKSHVYKIYEAVLDGNINDADIRRFSEGVVTETAAFLPARLWLEDDSRPNIAKVRIREGKFHQVKRMFASCGKNVVELKRLQIGDLHLDEKLPEGGCRLLSAEEIGKIFAVNLH